MKLIQRLFHSAAAWAKLHKVYATILILAIVGGGYWSYSSATKANAAPTYTLAMARIGAITQTVTGTGQVSAENQLDVTSQVSGAVKSIAVSVGDHVVAGQLLATIDSHDASISLQNAQIAWDKLVATPKAGDLANSRNSVAKAYNDALNSVAASFSDLQTVMAGLKSMLYDQGGFLSVAYSTRLNSTAQPMRDASGVSYDSAAKQYAIVLAKYQSLNRSGYSDSTASSINSLLQDTQTLLKAVANTTKLAQTTVNYIIVNQSDYYSKDAPTASSNISSWVSTVNGDVASIISSISSVTSSVDSLNTLVTGADELDLASQRLSLQQAQDTYAKYFIRAPFDGIVGRIPVSIYSQASGSTVIATIVGDQKISTISLNEVDAAKVAAGQTVTLTFDAIDSFTATGTVKSVDLVGSVSSGVVSYGVKIVINTADARIKPGMSMNATIVTKHKEDVLVVPSTAVKTANGSSYLQTFDRTVLGTAPANANRFASSTAFASSTLDSSTRRTGAVTFGSQALTVSTATTPVRTTVVIGDSDGTYTEILSGIDRGQLVVTKTSAAGAASTAAPSILQSIGGGSRAGAAGARPAGNAVRIGG